MPRMRHSDDRPTVHQNSVTELLRQVASLEESMMLSEMTDSRYATSGRMKADIDRMNAILNKLNHIGYSGDSSDEAGRETLVD